MIVCKECGHHNPNGSTFCHNSDCGVFLEWSGDPVETSTLPKVVGTKAKKAALTASISSPDIAVEPGDEARCQVRIRNKGSVVDQFRVEIRGEPAAWAAPDAGTINLLPETEGSTEIAFRPPRSSEVTAGPKPFQLRITSTEDPDQSRIIYGQVTVGAFREVTATLVPRDPSGRHGSVTTVTVVNGGNAPLNVRLSASDPNAALAFTISPPALLVPPGGRASAEVKIQTRREIEPGTPERHTFEVVAEAEGVEPTRLPGTFVQQPPPAPTPVFTRTRVFALRVALTLLGGLAMILGAFMPWFSGATGTELRYDEYVEPVFGVDVLPPPDQVPDILTSVGLPAILLGAIAVFGVFGKGRLTRFAAVAALLVHAAFIVTVRQAGIPTGSGLNVVVVGAVVAFVGGLLGRVGGSD